MKTPGIRYLFAIFAGAWLSTAQAEAIKGFSIGEAYNLNGDDLLYRETHCQSDDQRLRKVIYENQNGESIAYKRIDYDHDLVAPSFKQTNLLTKEETEVTLDDKSLTMSFTNASREQTVKTIDSNAARDRLPVVIDAGFDAYIQQNWDKLVTGETLRFQFPLASRTTLVELEVSAASCSFETENNQCFKMEMSNWLYAMLADPIELGYDREQKHLLRYRGLSNIEDENGSGLDVDIRYSYGDIPLQACQLEGLASHG